MEQNSNNQQELKSRLIFFFGKNKYTIVFTLLILISIPVVLIFFQTMNEKKWIVISKFIQAGLYLSSNNLEESRTIYEEIILDKNKFYSLLALNTIIEKNLEKDNKKIFDNFEIIENLGYSDEQKDLFNLKKALFYQKINNKVKSDELLQKLIDKESKYKKIAEGIILD